MELGGKRFARGDAVKSQGRGSRAGPELRRPWEWEASTNPTAAPQPRSPTPGRGGRALASPPRSPLAAGSLCSRAGMEAGGTRYSWMLSDHCPPCS